MLTNLVNYLKTWTPLSIIVIMVAAAMVFIIIWDTMHNITIPAAIWGAISFITSGAGVASIAANTAKETAHSTAAAVITGQQNGGTNGEQPH